MGVIVRLLRAASMAVATTMATAIASARATWVMTMSAESPGDAVVATLPSTLFP
jgi:hypothetical protein